MSNGEVIPEGSITFATGKSTLNSSSELALKSIKKFLDDKTYVSTLRVEGHVQGADNNQNLSEARAVSVCNWLIEHGIDCKRLIAVGFGENKPVAAGTDPANTRITFVSAALKGRPIGGMALDGGGQIARLSCE
jgi:OOP family OmpA-OmpF porin